MAFFNPNLELGLEYNHDEQRWLSEVRYYANTNINRLNKETLLNFFIKNYTNTQDTPIRTLYWEFTRAHAINAIASSIASITNTNTVVFIKKTAVSGRAISNLISLLNDNYNIQATELTNVSLVLQNNNVDPIRVYKIETENNTTQYVIIGNKHMEQRVRYICLGLTSNWFPTLLNTMSEDQLEAFKNLCYTIGKMDNDQYEQQVLSCLMLCQIPPEPEIDFTSIGLLLKNNISERINKLQNKQQDITNQIQYLLQNYEDYKNTLQKVEWELTNLKTTQQADKTQEAIEMAKKFKSIVNYKYSGNTHSITIRSKMLLESDAIVKKILAPENSTAHNHYNIHSEQARRLLEDLWLNKILQLDFCTTFHRDNHSAVPSCQIPVEPRLVRHTMPNPHLIHYSCFGDNRRQLIDATQNNNLEYYLGCLTASNSNLNTGDATVLARFCEDLFGPYVNTRLLYDVEKDLYLTPRERMNTYETV